MPAPHPVLRDIIAAAKAHGMTAYSLAKAADVPVSSVQRILKADSNPTLATLEAVASVLGLEIVVQPAGKVAVRRKGS